MLAPALRDPVDRQNLMGDVPALILIAVVLAALMRTARPSGARV